MSIPDLLPAWLAPPSSPPPDEADDAWAQPPPPEHRVPVDHAATRQILALRTMVATLEKKLSKCPSTRQMIITSQESKTLKMQVKRVEGERDKLAAENAELKRQAAHWSAKDAARKREGALRQSEKRRQKEQRDQLNYAAYQAAVARSLVSLPAGDDYADTVESIGGPSL